VWSIDETSRPLWQLLLLVNESEGSVQLTCEECFILLEYDADLLAAGARLDEILPSIRHHLNLCAKCQVRFDDWMEHSMKMQNLQPDLDKKQERKKYYETE
jgi:hypothetical protein